MKIDGERLLTWIDEQGALLVESQAGQTEESAAYQRLEGAMTMLARVRSNLHSLSDKPKPIREMKVPTAHKVRRRDPSTSLQAALSQTPDKSRMLYTTIYAVLGRRAMTDEELLDLFTSNGKEVTPSGVRSRRAELAEAGWVRDSGEKRDTKSGHPSIVWEAVPSVI